MKNMSIYFIEEKNACLYTGEDNKPHIMTIEQGKKYLQSLYDNGWKKEKNYNEELNNTLYKLYHY